MKTLAEVLKRPSALDSIANYMGPDPDDFKDWFVVCTQNRDSGVLERSNFRSALKKLGGESADVRIYRFGHWACGWWEALAVGGEAVKEGQEIRDGLDDYPVIDESDYSELEQEEANDVWKNCFRWRERAKYIREHESQFEFRDFQDLLNNVRGEWFSGYASELAN